MNFCTSCDHDFTSVSAFDKHRVGSFVLKTRRCMSESEMIDHQLEQKPSGKWGFLANAALLTWTGKLRRQEKLERIA